MAASGTTCDAHDGEPRCRRDDLAEQFMDNFDVWAAGEPLRNTVDKRLGYVPVS